MEKEDLQKYLNLTMSELNDRPLPYFENYSPHEIHSILHHSFEDNAIISLKKMSDADYEKSPIFMQMKSLAEIVRREKEIKLTKNGYLPPKFVIELYGQDHFKEYPIEQGYTKLKKEADSELIPLSRFILESAGIFSLRKGVLKLSKKGEDIIKEKEQFFRLLFIAFTNRLDWSTLCGYQMKEVGQLGVGFSLALLAKYGDVKNTDEFYAEKYLRAFPMLMEGYSSPAFGTLESWFGDCYSLRTFGCFLKYWGLIHIERNNKYYTTQYITKSEIFDKLIKCLPPKECLKIGQEIIA